jgi:serine/threonine-protein kinase HipA
MGQHHLDVCGEGAAIERRHLLRLAEEGGVSTKQAEAVIDRMLLQASSLAERFERAPIRQMLAQQIKSTIDTCRLRLER